jgi:hypothetical protein
MATELPISFAHGIKPTDLLGGINRVHVDDRGDGRFVKFVPVDGDPIGGVIVELAGGITCAFANDASLSISGRITVPVGAWKMLSGSSEDGEFTAVTKPVRVITPEDEDWVCLYAAGNTAGRVDVRGYITYAPNGEAFSTSSIPANVQDPIAFGKKCVAKALQDQGVDIASLEEAVDGLVAPPATSHAIEPMVIVDARGPVAPPVAEPLPSGISAPRAPAVSSSARKTK